MNPGWDEPPLDIQIPDDARELERDVIAYHRELRALRRRRRLRRLTGPFGGQGTVMPLLASILAVCLVAGAMLSVATFSPDNGTGKPSRNPSATAASAARSSPHSSAAASSSAASSSTAGSAAASSGPAASGAADSASASPASARPSAGGSGTARPSGSANSSARSAPSAPPASVIRHIPGGP